MWRRDKHHVSTLSLLPLCGTAIAFLKYCNIFFKYDHYYFKEQLLPAGGFIAVFLRL